DKNINLFIHPRSTMFQSKTECIIFTDVLETTKTYANNVSFIERAWIEEIDQFWANV
ncbi:MAG: hypothetical protein MHPSP_004074, partial [Paramarteilia canceri]